MIVNYSNHCSINVFIFVSFIGLIMPPLTPARGLLSWNNPYTFTISLTGTPADGIYNAYATGVYNPLGTSDGDGFVGNTVDGLSSTFVTFGLGTYNPSYAGGTATSYGSPANTVMGDFFQLQIPTSIIPYSFYISAYRNIGRMCTSGMLLGSSDCSTWTSLVSFAGLKGMSETVLIPDTHQSSQYNCFRMVCTKVAGSNAIELSEFYISG